jgi:integrase
MSQTVDSEEMKREQHDVLEFTIMLLDTGAWYNELAKLEWSQVDLQKKEIHLWRPKVRIESILFMTDRVYNILKQRFDNAISEKYVFTNKKGEARGYVLAPIQN